MHPQNSSVHDGMSSSNHLRPLGDTRPASLVGISGNAKEDNPCNVAHQSTQACMNSVVREAEGASSFIVGDMLENTTPEASPISHAFESHCNADNMENTEQMCGVHPWEHMDKQGRPIYSMASSYRHYTVWERNPGDGETYRSRCARLSQGVETPTTTIHRFPMVSPPGGLYWCQLTHFQRLLLGPQNVVNTHGDPLHPEACPMQMYSNIVTACSADYGQQVYTSGQVRSSQLQQSRFDGAQVVRSAANDGERICTHQFPEESGKEEGASSSMTVGSHTVSVAEVSRFAVGLATIFRKPPAISSVGLATSQPFRDPVSSSRLQTSGRQHVGSRSGHGVQQTISQVSVGNSDTNRSTAVAFLASTSVNEGQDHVVVNRDNLTSTTASNENWNQSFRDFTYHSSGDHTASQGEQLSQGASYYQSPSDQPFSQWHRSSSTGGGWCATRRYQPWMNSSTYMNPGASEVSNVVTNGMQASHSPQNSQADIVPMGTQPDEFALPVVCTSLQGSIARPAGTQTVALSGQISSTALYRSTWALPCVTNAPHLDSLRHVETGNSRVGDVSMGADVEGTGACTNVAVSPTSSRADCLPSSVGSSAQVTCADRCQTLTAPGAPGAYSSTDTPDIGNSCSLVVSSSCKSPSFTQQPLVSLTWKSDCREATATGIQATQERPRISDSKSNGIATSAISYATAIVRGIPAASSSRRLSPAASDARRAASGSTAPNQTTLNLLASGEGLAVPPRSQMTQAHGTSERESPSTLLSARDRIQSTVVLEQSTDRTQLTALPFQSTSSSVLQGALPALSLGLSSLRLVPNTFRPLSTSPNDGGRPASGRDTTAGNNPSLLSDFQQRPTNQAGAFPCAMSIPMEQNLHTWVQTLVSKSTALPSRSDTTSAHNLQMPQQGLSSAPYLPVQPSSSNVTFQAASPAIRPATTTWQSQYVLAPQILPQETRPAQQPPAWYNPASSQHPQYGPRQNQWSAPRQWGPHGNQHHLQQGVPLNPIPTPPQGHQQAAPQWQQQSPAQPPVSWSQPVAPRMNLQQQQQVAWPQQQQVAWPQQQQMALPQQQQMALPQQQQVALPQQQQVAWPQQQQVAWPQQQQMALPQQQQVALPQQQQVAWPQQQQVALPQQQQMALPQQQQVALPQQQQVAWPQQQQVALPQQQQMSLPQQQQMALPQQQQVALPQQQQVALPQQQQMAWPQQQQVAWPQQQQVAWPQQQCAVPWQRQQQAIVHVQGAVAMPNQQFPTPQNQTVPQEQSVIRVSQSIDISVPTGAPLTSFRSASVLPPLGIPAPAMATGRQPSPVLRQSLTWHVPGVPVPPPPPPQPPPSPHLPPPAPQVWHPQPQPFYSPPAQNICPPPISLAIPASGASR